MDPRRDPLSGPEPLAVRLSDPGEVAAALPALLGFRPRESVVLLSLAGPGGSRVGLTVRADLPSEASEGAAADELVRSVCSDRPAAVLLVVVSEVPDVPARRGTSADGDDRDLPHRGLVAAVVRALAVSAVGVRDALLVRAGRWWSYDCRHPCCAPAAGTPVPEGVTALEAAAVVTGTVVAADRSELVRRIAGPGRRGRADMAAACEEVAAECTPRVRALGVDAVAEESWSALVAAADRCRPDAPWPALGDRELARVVWGLRDREVRDRALALALGAQAPAAELLWTECTRRAPAPLDVAPATLLAVSAWLRGDGAMANVALARALTGEPTYALARLLAQALGSCLPPGELRAMIGAALAGSDPRN